MARTRRAISLEFKGEAVRRLGERRLHGNQVLNTVYVTEDRPDDFPRKMAEAARAILPGRQ